MKKQIIGLIISIVFVLSMFITICANAKYIFTRQDYYSEKEVNEMLIQEYDKAVEENSDKNLVLKVSKLQEENKKLLSENETLKSDNSKKEETIKNNKETIDSLNSQVSNLEINKEENELLISDLTSQINELDKQNKLLEYEISENDYLIEENNKTITQLQNSIAYYEDFINGLENDSEVFAIFVIENEIFNIQKLNKNGLAYLETDPVFGVEVKFNGWKVNGELVDLSSYTLSCNTTFVADLTYSRIVNFMVDEVCYNAQCIPDGSYATLPEVPTKEGCLFVGWSLNNIDIVENIESIPVLKNTNYYAVFKSIYKVDFLVDNEIYNSQEIVEGDAIIIPEEPFKDNYLFLGWSLNGSTVYEDIDSLVVSKNTTISAIFEEIVTTASLTRNGAVVGSISSSQNKTVITMSSGYFIESLSFKSSKNSSTFVNVSITTNKYDDLSYGDYCNCSIGCYRKTVISTVTLDCKPSVFLNKNNKLVYVLNFSGYNSISITAQSIGVIS